MNLLYEHNRSPLVSICVCSYNHAKFLPETLDSILAQTYLNTEIIIVDDGSSDGSLELICEYAAKHPTIKVFTHPGHVNRGISSTANLAIQQSNGEFVSCIGSDDVWYTDTIERQVAAMNEDSEVGLVYGLAQTINEVGGNLPEVRGDDIVSGQNTIEKLIHSNAIPAPTVMVRMKCLKEIGLFDENLVYGDWELWVRLLSHWKGKFINDPLAAYRIHGNNTSVGISQKTELKNRIAVLSKVLNSLPTLGDKARNPGIEVLLRIRISRVALDLFYEEAVCGDLPRALYFLQKAVLAYPNSFFEIRRILSVSKYSMIAAVKYARKLTEITTG